MSFVGFFHFLFQQALAPVRCARAIAVAVIVTAVTADAATPVAPPKVPAFPGAEGAGMFVRGGRAGRVIEVTNLADHGPGSFRAAVEAAGPRTVVFRVSGIVTLESPVVIRHPYLTIAGQTAPGDGICIRGDTTTIDAEQVIVRYLRFRRGDLESRDDALNAVHSPGRIIVDHCSFSWGLDENVSIYRYMKPLPDGKFEKNPVEEVTIQWCISSEALDLNNHAFGATWGGRGVSFHHNLFAHNTARNASIGWGDHVDFRNNVIYNWSHRTLDGGDLTSHVNVVGNYFKAGPATRAGELQYRIARPEPHRNFDEGPTPGYWHIEGNEVHGHPEVTADNWAGGVQMGEHAEDPALADWIERSRTRGPARHASVVTQTAAEAYELVLAGAGATLPRRDSVDTRVVGEVRSGGATYGKGIVRVPDDVGGWPAYESIPALLDADHDGMPDAWERRHGFDPYNPADGPADADKDGYTNLEEYLNGTDPRVFVDYTDPANNVNTLR
ncbi:polysaccharide lyase [Opitutales bacterium ASA1]|nr:polysaccharide lyase [Opitutales bacterium ASA1]